MLLTARYLSKSYGARLLFANITLGIDEGDRIGLIGANGSGKSTMLRLFAGLEQPDEGELIARRGLRVGYVAQQDAVEPGLSCADSVAAMMDAHLDDHERHARAIVALERAGFPDPSASWESLSGGWRKRLAIVRQIAAEPDLLLMDEPTNHLDVEGTLWLEVTIARAHFATLTISHDRRFLDAIANRIIELGRAYPEGYLSHQGSYSEFAEKREAFLEAQEAQERALASGVKREIEWLQRGAKARTTKAKGRIERAHDMMAELSDLKARNVRQSAAGVDFASSERRTRKLIQLKGVAKALGGRTLFSNLDLVIAPGQRLGLLGPNGSGKSTLIRILRGSLEPDAGQVIRADDLKVVVFDQHREQLDPDQSLRRALAPGGDTLVYQGNALHVSGWAKRFLFRSEQLDLPVSELSGGEQARVLIARLMLQPADLLILDEPTNDLDIPTLDVLESSLAEFTGGVVLVTHDRYMLDRVSTDLLALDGQGNAHPYAELAQWEKARDAQAKAEAAEKKAAARPAAAAQPQRPVAKKKLSWNEQKEYDGMEAAIAKAEEEVANLQETINDPKVIIDHTRLHEACEKLGQAQQEVDRLYARWAELEGKKE